MRKKKAFWIFLLIAVVTLRSVTLAAEDQALSWYCPKSKDHAQPIADAPLRVIEKYGGYYVDTRHGDGSVEKVIYLTFDAGYENGNVERILDTLKEEDVTAAFFILGNLISRNPELVKRMGDEGHLICNHTYHHKDMTRIDDFDAFREELESLEALYRETTGKELSKYYRPPEGKFDERSLRYASELGYRTIFWSVAYADWDNKNQPSAQTAKAKILER